MVVHLLSVLLILLFGQKASTGPVSGLFDTSASVRDSRSCDTYYSWVKNQYYGTWELERRQCPDSLYFEPTLNACKPADQLVIKCAVRDPKSRRARHLMTRDEKYRDQTDEDLKYSEGEVPDKSMSPSSPEYLQSAKKHPFRRFNGTSTGAGTKRRNNNGRPNKRRNKKKKNWVAIFVRGCNSQFGNSPFDDDDEQPEQLEEDEFENQENDDIEGSKPSGNHTTNVPHNNNELGDGSNDNSGKPYSNGSNDPDESRLKPSSPNCTCNNNNQSTTSKPDCDKHSKKDNLTASSSTPLAAPSSTPDQKPSGSTPVNNPNVSTAAPNITPSSTNKPTNSPIRENSPSASSQSSTPHRLPQSTSPAKPPATSARPPATTPKPRPSRIVLIPLKITNPHNSKNSTGKVDEKEALRRFLEELKKRRPNLSKESEKQLAMLFKAKVRGMEKADDDKSKEPVAASYDQVDPSMVRSKSQNETNVKDLKLDKLEKELGIGLAEAFNYYTNLADGTNSTDRRA